MNLSDKLKKELATVLYGNPWYGRPVYDIIDEVIFEVAYEKLPSQPHNIAGIVLHMVSWTEEVMDRMNGMTAQQPSSGDWPDPGTPDEQKWQNYINDLKLVNVNLLNVIQHFPEEQWAEPYLDERNDEPSEGTSYEELIRGLIQHHIYHSAQIVLLARCVS